MAERYKTSISVDKAIWKDWVRFVVMKTGSTKTVGSETELAIKEYMKRHSAEKKQLSE